MTQVTVVTPCYNSARFIRETIASVLNQNDPRWEYFLIDDGSTDQTAQILGEFESSDSRIKVLRQKNQGTCRARNLGAAKAMPDSKYLLFLDHDDLLEPDALKKLSAYLDAKSQVGLVACQIQEIDEQGGLIASSGRSRWVPAFLGIPRQLRPNEVETPFVTFYCATGQGPFAMFRRSIFEQTAQWTTEFWPHEDTDIFCQMALLGQVHFLPDRLYRKRVHATSGLFSDAKRVMDAYTLFRAKWDQYQPRNDEEACLLQEAARFYRGLFRPLRNIKVGTKAMGEFARTGRTEKLSWAIRLYAHGVRDIFRYRFFNRPHEGSEER